MTPGADRCRRRLLGGGLALAVAVVAAACATKAPPPLTPGALRFPDFVYPDVPDGVGDAGAASRHEAAWRHLQAGDTRAAAREYAAAAGKAGAFFPAEAGLGYVLIADRRFDEALARFDRVLRLAPAYAPALAGRGEALAATGRVELAIASFEAARQANPALADLSRRVDILRFGRMNELVGEGARAASAGRLDEARRAYEQAISAAPDTAFLYRDLGIVELRAGRLDAAAHRLDRSLVLDAGDARSWSALADVHEKAGRLTDAMAALERAAAIDPSDVARRSLDRVRTRMELAALPAEYRAIPQAAAVDRGDVAALLGVRLVPALPADRRATGVVVTDSRAHWAATWIVSVTRLGLMDVFPNHTFQPRAAVKRIDLAQIVSRVVSVLGARPVRTSRPEIGDVPGNHLSYDAVAVAVATGVMPLLDGGMFRPSRPVTGAEAAEVVERLERLARRRHPGGSRF